MKEKATNNTIECNKLLVKVFKDGDGNLLSFDRYQIENSIKGDIEEINIVMTNNLKEADIAIIEGDLKIHKDFFDKYGCPYLKAYLEKVKKKSLKNKS